MCDLVILLVIGSPSFQKLWIDVVTLSNIFVIILRKLIDTNLSVFEDIRGELSLFFQIV